MNFLKKIIFWEILNTIPKKEKGMSVIETLILVWVLIITLIWSLYALKYFIITFTDIIEVLKFLI
jgi:hypothetical protein